MNPVLSFDQYTSLTKAFQQKHGHIRTSNILLPADAKAAIEEGRLFFLENDCALLLIIDEGNVYRCFAMLNPAVPPQAFDLKPDKRLLLDVPQRIKQDILPDPDPVWKTLGLVYRATHIHIIWEPKEDVPLPVYMLHEEPELTPEMIDNWFAYLDTDAVVVPTYSRAVKPGERMFTIRDEESSRVLSQMLAYPDGRKANLNALITVPDQRGKGLAKAMMRGVYSTLHTEGVTRLSGWVDSKNVSGWNSYRKVGYVYDKIISFQFADSIGKSLY